MIKIVCYKGSLLVTSGVGSMRATTLWIHVRIKAVYYDLIKQFVYAI